MNRTKLKSGLSEFPKILLFLSMSLVFALTACKKEYFELDRVKDTDWEPTLAVPLVNSKVTVPDILDRFDDDEVITIDSQGQLALLYFSKIFSATAEGLMLLPDFAAPAIIPLTPTEIAQLNSGQPVTKPTTNVSVPLSTSGNEVFDQVDFKAGDLQLDIQNNINRDVTVTLTFNDLTSNGSPLVLSSSPAANASTSTNQSVAGHSLLLSQGNNEFQVSIDVVVSGSGGPVAAPNTTIDVTLTLSNLAFSRVIGNFGNLALNFQDSVRLRIFENSLGGNITWADPKIRAIFSSSLGADIQASVNRFDAFNENNGQLLGITGLNVVTIAPPAIQGQTEVSTYLLDNNNSNIQAVTQISPTRIIYNVTGQMNPSGSPVPNPNFALDTSKVSLDVEVELPFEGTASDFTKSDTIQLDIFPLNDDIEEIQEVTLRLELDNGFPVEGRGQVYFHDSTIIGNSPNPAIDSLIANPQDFIVESATLGPDGRVSSRTAKVTEFTLSRGQLEQLEAQGMRYLVVIGKVSTTNNGNTVVKIFNTYDMGIRLGMKVRAKTRLEF